MLGPWRAAGAGRAVVIEPGQCKQVRGFEVAQAAKTFMVSQLPGQGPGPAACIGHGTVSRTRGTASVMGTGDHDDQAVAHELLR